MFRSTKGASKQRRDLINGEITVLRDMLPLPEAARQRLSQLQIMSLACVYIRKCNFFNKFFGESDSTTQLQNFEFSQSMTGFLLVASRDGKLLYISENVTEYLGHSMVDMMTQGDSIYDIIDKRDHSLVQSQLTATQPQADYESSMALGAATHKPRDERAFFCRMNVARSFRRQAGFGDHKMMHVKGHFVQSMLPDHYSNQPVFMGFCSPLITPDVKDTVVQNSTTAFYSVHRLDMRFDEISHIGQNEVHLGYAEEDLIGTSWYQLIHPEDIHEAKEKHDQLIKSSHEMGCTLTIRLQSKTGFWVWINIVMHIRQPFVCDNGEPAIICINQVISESEAQMFRLQSQQYSSQIAAIPEILGPSHSPQHTVAQVAVAGPSYESTAEQRSDEGLSYQLLVSATTKPTSSAVVSNQPSDMSVAIVPTTTDSKSQLNYASEQKLSNREELFMKLKRKSGSPQHCKPTKLRRTEQNNMSPRPGLENNHYQASFISIFDNLGGGDLPNLGHGDLQLLTQAQDGPRYQMLHMKRDALLKTQPLVVHVAEPTLETVMQALSPLTPDSITSDTMTDISKIDISNFNTAGLKLEATVPDFMLTPDASPISTTEEDVPMMSPDPQTDPTESYQTVADHDLLLFPEVCLKKPQQPQHPPARAAPIASMRPSSDFEQWLPEMDSHLVTTILNEIEKISQIPTVAELPAVVVESPRHLTADVLLVQQQQQQQQQQHDLLAELIKPENEVQLLNQVTNVLRDIVEKATDSKLFSQLMATTDDMSAVLRVEQPSPAAPDVDLFKADEGMANYSPLAQMTPQPPTDDVFNFQLEDLLSEEFERSTLQYAGDSDLPSSLFA